MIKKILLHSMIPILILSCSLSTYYLSSQVLRELISDEGRINKIETMIIEKPARAGECGVHFYLESEKMLNSALLNLQVALKGFLVNGAIVLFLIAIIREYYIFKITNKSWI